MPKCLTATLVLVLALTSGAIFAQQESRQHTWDGIERIVAVGDVHGDHGQFLKTLFAAKVIDQDTRWIGSTLKSANNLDELGAKVNSSKGVLKQKVIDQEAKNGSMWVFKKVLKIDMHVGRYKPLKGNSYIELPKPLALKKCIVNVQNQDDWKWDEKTKKWKHAKGKGKGKGKDGPADEGEDL